MKNLSSKLFAVIVSSMLTANCGASTPSQLVPTDDEEIEEVIEEVENAREKGVPLDAKPVAYYFNEEANGSRMVLERDVSESCVSISYDNQYYFFVQPLEQGKDDIFQQNIAIWMYDKAKGEVSNILRQSETVLGEWDIMNIEMFEAVGTKEGQEYNTPMLLLKCGERKETHPTSSTIFLHPITGRSLTLENERLIEVLHPTESTTYIITTTRIIAEEELSDFETERRAPKIHITPILKVYTTFGELIREVKLPTDETFDVD